MQISSHYQPAVSVGMPVFNCAGTIAQAISSILNQTFDDWELLIIDDGSTDNTVEIAKSFDDPRIIVTRGGANKRLPARLNECISSAKGRFFARMDGDDIAYPGRLQCQLEYLQSHQAVDLVGGWVVVFRDDGTAFGAVRGPLSHEHICAHPWKGMTVAHSTWMGKIEWFRRNRYPTVAASEDQELLFRTYQKSRFANVPTIVLGYREDTLPLRYHLIQQWYVSKSIIRNASQQGRLMSAGVGIVRQVAKGVIYTFAICTGLKYHVLRHRARALRNDEDRDWRSVWEQVRSTVDKFGARHLALSDLSQNTSV